MHLLLRNYPLVCALIAWTLAQGIKVILFSILERRFYWQRILETGGLPSAHSALVMGLATGVGIQEGFQSTLFGITAVFASVVMYDALTLRREAGKHADLLNELILLSHIQEAFKEREALKELLGHTPLEVFAGAMLGIGTALLTHAWGFTP